MSYVILGIICLAAGFVAGFLVNRNNSVKLKKIEKCVASGDVNCIVKEVQSIIDGTDCKDCQ